MFELFKLIWDVVVLRDASQKGRYNWRIWPLGFGFVLVLYGAALPAFLLYDKHPQYKPLFLATLIFEGIFLIGFMAWAWRWQARQAAARNSAPANDQPR